MYNVFDRVAVKQAIPTMRGKVLRPEIQPRTYRLVRIQDSRQFDVNLSAAKRGRHVARWQ